MITSGPRFPTAASADGTGSNGTWIHSTNIFVEDGSTADSTYWLDVTNTYTVDSGVLTGSGFNFTIPTGATILGIKLEIKKSGVQAIDESIRLMKAGSAIGSNKADGTMSTGLSWDTYGSTSDLWGTTWTPADINNAGFGASMSFNATHDAPDSGAHIDAIRITVYYNPPAIPYDPSFPKTYTYKVYTRAGQYLGNLPTPSSEFGFSQNINTGGSQITVTCPTMTDISSLPSSGGILDETGGAILDEGGTAILSESNPSIIGLGGSTALVSNGNEVVVWEYSGYYPSGHIIFQGEIQRWESDFGGASGDEQVKIVVYSDGNDLDNYLLTGSPFTYTADQSQTSQNTAATINNNTADRGAFYNYYGQTFTIGSGVTNLGRIDVLLAGAANVTLNVYSAPNTTTILASTTVNVNTGGGAAVVSFAFGSHLPVTSGTQYFFTLTTDSGQSIYVYYQNTNVYSGGSLYNASYAGGGGGSYGPITTADMYFVTYSSSGSTIATFTSVDPTTGMLEPFMTDYQSRGGSIGYDSSTIDATGLSLTYQFNTNTVYEGIKAVLSLAPDGFYYYVDLGTDKLHFKNASTTADILLTKGIHMDKLTIVATIENIINFIPFSGGIPAGGTTNLYKLYASGSSIAAYGQRLDRKSDNRVTVAATADAIGYSELAEMKGEQYQTTVSIVDQTMDISSIKVGMIVGFRNFGTFADQLLAQIVRLDYTPGEATLTLGILPKRTLPAFEKITRGLIAEQTIANPSAPS